MKSDLVDIEACRHAETSRAILVSDDGERKHAVWLPKQHCEIAPGKASNRVTVTMPEWLAVDKGLV
jgi:hypothetical protein